MWYQELELQVCINLQQRLLSFYHLSLKNKNTFERILAASHEEIYLFTATTFKFIQVSQGTLSNLGYTDDEMLNLTPIDIKPMVSATEFKKIVEPLVSGEKEIIYFETIYKISPFCNL